MRRASLLLVLIWLRVSPCLAGEAAGDVPHLRHPIVLIPASMGGLELRVGPVPLGDYFQGLPEYLAKGKNRVFVPTVPIDSSIEEGALAVRNELRREFHGEPVNIIAHSIGGLQARYLVSVLKYPYVRSITSIATPHRGVPLADWAIRQVRENSKWYRFARFFGYDMRNLRFLADLSPAFLKDRFNTEVLDLPEISYFSVVGWAERRSMQRNPLLLLLDEFLRIAGGPEPVERDDGLVPVSSQKWGTVIAEVPLDHLAQINHHTLRLNSKADESLELYRRIALRLGEAGF